MKQSMNVDTENFELIFETSNQKVMNNLRVGTLARIISIDKTTRTISVQPIVQEKINCDNELGYKYIKLPVISNIPYISGQYPQINDYVICVHLDRTKSGIDLLTDTTSFIESNTNRHNLNDCIAIVINTKDEWKLIGTYPDVETDIDVSNYTELLLILIHDNIQLCCQTLNLNIVNNCVVGSVSPTKTAQVSVNNGKLDITQISSDTMLMIYGR